MKAEPMKRFLMQQLMPVLGKAMVDATEQQVPNPVQFVAEELVEVSIHPHTYKMAKFAAQHDTDSNTVVCSMKVLLHKLDA